jgi:hypothetical protein
MNGFPQRPEPDRKKCAENRRSMPHLQRALPLLRTPQACSVSPSAFLEARRRVVMSAGPYVSFDRAVSRRDFVKVCTMAAAAVGLSATAAAKMAEAAARGLKP